MRLVTGYYVYGIQLQKTNNIWFLPVPIVISPYASTPRAPDARLLHLRLPGIRVDVGQQRCTLRAAHPATNARESRQNKRSCSFSVLSGAMAGVRIAPTASTGCAADIAQLPA